METIDNVLEQLVLTGGSKIDWQPGESRRLVSGDWSINSDIDCSNLDHLPVATRERLHRLSIHHDENCQLVLLFDPITRRIEAMEVIDLDTGCSLLTLTFWPGLESARKLTIATINQWQRAIDNGWFEGID